MQSYKVVASTTTMGLSKTLPKSVREAFAKQHNADPKQVKTTYDRVDLNTKEALQGISIWKNAYLNGNLPTSQYFNGRKPLILNNGGQWQFFDINDVTHFISEFSQKQVIYNGVCDSLIANISNGSYEAQLTKISGDLPVSPITIDEVVAWKSMVKVEFYTDNPTGLMGDMLKAYEEGQKVQSIQKTLPIRKFLMEELEYEVKQCTALLDPSKPRKCFKGRQENLNRIRDMIKAHVEGDVDGEFTIIQGMLDKVESLLKGVQESTSDKVSDTLKDSIEGVKIGLKDISFEDIINNVPLESEVSEVSEVLETLPTASETVESSEVSGEVSGSERLKSSEVFGNLF